MKIALVNPGKSQRFSVHEPLNLAFIASYLEKNNFKVIILDELAGEDVEKGLKRFNPDMVGITATTALAPDAYRIARLCKRIGILTIIGGVHATIFPEEALRYADIVVQGEGELGMIEVLNNNIRSGIVNAPYIKEIDQIPIPARHLLKMDFYLKSKDRIPYIIYYAFVPAGVRIASLLTSRGCPYSCIYCHNTWRGTPVRFHSSAWVISEIERLKKDYNIQAAYFVEDNFFFNKKRAIEICELIIMKKIKLIWGGSTRADNIDLDMLKLAKQAGCRLVNFGFESGSQRILDRLKKGLKVEDSKRAIGLCNQAGIMANGSFMIGNPGETEEDLELTKKFVRENKITLPAFYITTPYPGTELWKIAEEKGLIPDKVDWSTFNQERVVVNFSQVPQERIEELRASWYLQYFWNNKLEALKLILMSLRYPKASAEKISKTLMPLIDKFLTKFKL